MGKGHGKEYQRNKDDEDDDQTGEKRGEMVRCLPVDKGINGLENAGQQVREDQDGQKRPEHPSHKKNGNQKKKQKIPYDHRV